MRRSRRAVAPEPLARVPVSSRERKPARRAVAAASQLRSTGSADELPGAVPTPLPALLAPQLATLATAVPSTGEWSYEIKFDGYRIMARIDRGNVSLVTRGGHDWAAKMPELVEELRELDLGSAWLDGEIVVLGKGGAPDFNALQKSFDRRTDTGSIVYFLFDVPFLGGYDLRNAQLLHRRRLLRSLLAGKAAGRIRFSEDFEAPSGAVLETACRMGLEGVMAKRTDAPYASKRTATWLKLKCKQRQEFVVAGYTDRSDGAPQIGSLLLGVYRDSGELVSVGSVGTGWSASDAADLKQQLTLLEAAKSPFAAAPAKPGRWSKRMADTERWLEPLVVAEVEFAEWTPDGQIRHAAFVGIRTDKEPTDIRRETPKRAEQFDAEPTAVKARIAAVKVTHGERVIDPSTGLTKRDLVRYYEAVAERMLPHLKSRPVSLVRGPAGIDGALFFQKHDDKLSIPGLRALDPARWPQHPALLEVPSAAAIAQAAQMNVIEFHTWNSVARTLDRPDRMVFDLDPGDGTSWRDVQQAALLVRDFLAHLGLQSWLKTSGGKGLHVVVPLSPRRDYETVKDFSRSVVQQLASTLPSRFVAKSGPSNRIGKLFVDYLRNGPGATTAAAFSARARPGLGVSMPVSWDELTELRSGSQWSITTAAVASAVPTVDPWADYWKNRQTLTVAMRHLGFRPERRR